MLSEKQKIGYQKEKQALKYLKKQGLYFVVRNYITKLGEIDIVMLDSDILVFVEVRFRYDDNYGSALISVNRKKQIKIMRAAQYFLSMHQQYIDSVCRFDVVAIKPNLSDESKSIKLFTGFKNIFGFTRAQKDEITWIKNAFDLKRIK